MPGLGLLILILFTLPGCGPSPEQREKDRVHQQNDLAEALNRQGPPRASWSEERLNAFERQLNELERVDNNLNFALIAELRGMVAQVRRANHVDGELRTLSVEAKRRWAIFAGAHPDLDNAAGEELTRALAEVDELIDVVDRILRYDLTPESRASQARARDDLRGLRQSIDHLRLNQERTRERNVTSA